MRKKENILFRVYELDKKKINEYILDIVDMRRQNCKSQSIRDQLQSFSFFTFYYSNLICIIFCEILILTFMAVHNFSCML